MVNTPAHGTLLVVDDDPAVSLLVERLFRREGFHVVLAPDGQTGIDVATREKPDVVLLDLVLPDIDGLTVLERLKRHLPSLPIVMLTGSLDLKTAIAATRLGAHEYLTKPFNSEELIVTVRRAFEQGRLHAEVEALRREVGRDRETKLAQQMGPGREVQQIADQVATVAGSTFTVLIVGETGTGKELVAQAIHQASERRQKPFVALDCGAIPEPLLESELFGYERGAFTGAERRKEGRLGVAEGGTCFLDEVGNLPMSLQPKLLRALESREVQIIGATAARRLDVRFIAATNDDLHGRVQTGQFRADLYFRLAQYTIQVPPLRERRGDIPFLAERFVEEASLELRRPIQGITPDALDLLARQTWPGNVRQMRNVIRQAVLQTTTDLVIRQSAMQAALGRHADNDRGPSAAAPDTASLRETADRAARQAERQAIAAMLRRTGGNKSQAARLLQTDYKTLYVKMKQLGLRGTESD
jgi:DNA-binding NtrC family response regulator